MVHHVLPAQCKISWSNGDSVHSWSQHQRFSGWIGWSWTLACWKPSYRVIGNGLNHWGCAQDPPKMIAFPRGETNHLGRKHTSSIVYNALQKNKRSCTLWFANQWWLMTVEGKKITEPLCLITRVSHRSLGTTCKLRKPTEPFGSDASEFLQWLGCWLGSGGAVQFSASGSLATSLGGSLSIFGNIWYTNMCAL